MTNTQVRKVRYRDYQITQYERFIRSRSMIHMMKVRVYSRVYTEVYTMSDTGQVRCTGR